MDGKSDKSQDITKQLADTISKSNKCIPRGLLLREFGFKQKERKVSTEFQHAAEDKLVVKNHEELHCELPDASRSTFLMVFSPDGTKVASTHGNHNVYVTDLNTGKNVNTLSGHPRTPWCIAFHPSSNQILASGCLGGQVRVWDLHGGSEIWTAESETVIASLAFHPTDRMLVIATYNELHFWDWSQPVPFTKCYTTNEKEKVRYVAFDPLGHKLITGISNAPHNQSQWDRVANTSSHQGLTNPSASNTSQTQSNMMLPEHERRIATCYQSLVEQYERLVQRYYDLSRSRTAVTMDRGTDPMEMAESPSALPRPATSGTNTQSSGLMGHLLLGGNGESSSGGGTSSVGNDESTNRSDEDGVARDDAASTRGTGRGRFLRNISSLVLGHMIRRVQRQRATSSSRSSQIERVDQFPGSNTGTDTCGGPVNEARPVTNNVSFANTPSTQASMGQHGFTPITGYDRSEVSQEDSRPAASSTPISHSSGLPSDGIRDQPMRLGSIEIISESGEAEHHGLFSRLHSQVQPSTPCPPERPRRFFVSQRSAFQPRVPRADQQPQSESRPPRSSLLGSPRCSRFLLQRRLGHSQRPHADSQPDSSLRDSMSSAESDGSSEVGVRYGIQLLSRHIDNMQRLCRARLEILQLQQIRRMWEDLQRQIQSLHVAVIEGNFASSEAPYLPPGRSRRGRFRLYSHPGDLSNTRMRNDTRHYARRTADTSPGATEQGSHIPSVSQMLESARISDNSQPSNNRRDSGSSGSSESTVRNDQNSSSNAGLHEFGRAKPRPRYSERHKPSHTDTEAVGEIETSRNESVSENIASSSREHTVTDGKCSQTPVCSAAKATLETMDINSPGPSSRNTANNVSDLSTPAQKTEVDNMVPHKKSKIDGNKPKVAENSSSAESSSDNKSSVHSGKACGTTHLKSDRGSRSSANSTSHTPHSGNSSGESSENFTASVQDCPPSTHFPHRLWRISRRVYLRRPRLLAVGPRTRTMARHVSGSNISPHRGYSLFRPFDCGRRPWFLQSVASQSSQLDQSNSAALQDDANNNSRRSNDEDNPSSRSVDMQQKANAQAPSVEASHVERNASTSISSQRAQAGPSEQRQHKGARASQESTSRAGSSRGRETDNTGSNPATRGVKRKHDGNTKQTGSAPSQPNESSSQRTPHEATTSSSLRVMISRLSALVRQQREQQEAAYPNLYSSRRGNRRTNMWGLRETPGWLRSDGNSGSDSDSNPDNEQHRSWRRGSMEERNRDTAERDVSSRWSSPCQGEMDSEWVRESTRMRARQVLSMMVESLTQFFEANGLSNSTSHAVLDEQIYSLYVLLQLALELTDLLLAQLFTTRQQLEQQWVHRLHNPVALNSSSTPEDTTGGHNQGRRIRRLTRQDYEREFRRLDQIIGRADNGCRTVPYRNRLFRHSRGIDEDFMAHLDYLSGSSTNSADQTGSGVSRDESSRRLRPRVSFYQPDEAFRMYARYPVLTRVVRGTNCRPLMRTVLSRAESRLRSPSYSRDSIRTPPYVRGSSLNIFPRREERQSHSPPPDPSGTSHMPLSSPTVSSSTAEETQQSEQQQTTQQQSVSSQQQPQQDSFTVPLVRVNDVLIPDTSLLNQPSPRQRPQSPPPHPLPNIRNPFIQQQQQQGSTSMYSGSSIGDPWRYPGSPGYPGEPSWRSGWRPRFLHPRYVGPNPFSDDQEESLIGHPMESINVIRDSFIITDAPMSPNHRIQAWDFSKFIIPDIRNAEKNIIVAECKIHNDASVDVSSDGRLLVTLLPTGRLCSSTAMLGIYSLEWESLGQCLYTTSFEQNAVSVSLSPANRHLLVGLASRRVALLPSDRQTLAQIFLMEGGHPGRAVGARGRLCHIRDIEQSREQGYMSINCIRWAPGPGQGLVYGTNTGKLRVLR